MADKVTPRIVTVVVFGKLWTDAHGNAEHSCNWTAIMDDGNTHHGLHYASGDNFLGTAFDNMVSRKLMDERAVSKSGFKEPLTKRCMTLGAHLIHDSATVKRRCDM